MKITNMVISAEYGERQSNFPLSFCSLRRLGFEASLRAGLRLLSGIRWQFSEISRLLSNRALILALH